MSKRKDTLIDEHVSMRQCKRAIESLHAHSSKREQKEAETELLPGKEQHVWLQVAVKKMQPEKKIKPFKIPIVHPLVDPRTSPICLITKDPQREYKDLLESNGIKFISRVVGITKLRGKFKPFEARRMLLKENGMFLADERVIPLLPGLLGSKWFEAKKQPIPVCMTRKDLKSELERAISSTYMHQNKGTCTSIKIATTSQSPTQALANLEKALPAVIANIKGGWDNIQSLHLKTGESVALPVWTCGLGLEAEGGRWEGLVKGEGVDAEAESGSEDEMKVDETVPKKAGGKKSKRLLDDEVLDEKPKKKVKSAQGDDASLKKKGSSSTAAEPVPAPQATPIPTEPVPVTDGPKKKKRKSKIPSPEKVLPVSVKPVPTDLEAEADIDTEPTSTIASKPKKTKRKSKSRASVEDDLPEAIAESETLVVPVVSNGISKEELKQKRSTQSGERKKDKVVKKSGKSAKDALLGRKAGRS